LGLEQWYISQIIKGLSKEEKQAMVKGITDECDEGGRSRKERN
jgi:hypothetical protein